MSLPVDRVLSKAQGLVVTIVISAGLWALIIWAVTQ
jgi:hypothetical protein